MAARPPSRPARAGAVLLALALLAGALLAHPHAAPTLWLDIAITEEAVETTVTGLREIVHPWLGIDPALRGGLDDEQGRLARAGARAWFAAHDPVTIDGARVVPTVESLGPTDAVSELERPEYVRLVLRYRCPAPPRRVDFVWESYEGTNWMGEPQVPTMITWAGEPEVRSFSVQEPGYTWHAPPRPPQERPVGEVEAAAPGASRLPVPSIVLALSGLVLLLRPRPLRTWGVAACLGLALATLPIRVPVPWTARAEVALPTEPEAKRILETLLANVYRAFDAQGESRIYDVLAASVEGDLLEKTYGDVWESLILRDQGGAVCRVREVTHLGGGMEPAAEDGPRDRFTMTWRWKVRSDITHWGHTHQRVTLAEARFVVRHTGRAWKIHDYGILQQERTDDFSGESTQEALGRIR